MAISSLEISLKLNPQSDYAKTAKDIIVDGRNYLDEQQERKQMLLRERQQREQMQQAVLHFEQSYEKIHGRGVSPCALYGRSLSTPPCLFGRPSNLGPNGCDTVGACPRWGQYIDRIMD